MTSIRIKIEVTKKNQRWQAIPTVAPQLLIITLILSLIIHLGSWFGAKFVINPSYSPVSNAVKIRSLAPNERRILDSSQKEIEKAKRVVETQQTETTRPKVVTNLGAQDHVTEKETRLSETKIAKTKALDPGSATNTNQAPEVNRVNKSSSTTTKHAVVPRVIAAPGQMPVLKQDKTISTKYEKLLPQKTTDVFHATGEGFVEPLDKTIAEGDRVDMNTTNFRYLSYFTGLRKQIEMVWVYPSEAVRRGLQGAVQLEMIIEKDGRVSSVRIVNSSGYVTLDENMVKTIKLASPFAPLPKTWGKERLVVTGSFHYILSYASH